MKELKVLRPKTYIQLDTLVKQMNGIKQHLTEMAGKLQEILDIAQRNDYIELELLSDSIEFIQTHSQMQEEFFDQIERSFPEFTGKSIPLVEKLLADAKIQLEVCDSALTALNQFELVDIDHEETRILIVDCKKKALQLAKNSNSEELETAAEPYKIFLETMEHFGKELTFAQEEIIESEFPKPIPRMLYQGKFFLAQDNNIVARGDDTEQLVADESLTDSIDKGVIQEVFPKYTFRTEKEETAFQVKQFLSEIRNFKGSNRMGLLYVLGRCRMLSIKQLCSYALYTEHDEKVIDIIIRPLVKEGYLTEITNIESKERYYCFSAKGIQMFVRKDSVDEFKRRRMPIPRLLTDSKTFKENQDLIAKIAFFNERTLWLTEREIPNQGNVQKENLNTTLIHCETSIYKIPYAELTVQNSMNENQKYMVFSEFRQDVGEIKEVCGILADTSFDALIYFPDGKTDDIAWGILNVLPVEKNCCYLTHIDSNRLKLLDSDGNSYDSSKLIENLLPKDETTDSHDSYVSPEIAEGTEQLMDENLEGDLDKSKFESIVEPIDISEQELNSDAKTLETLNAMDNNSHGELPTNNDENDSASAIQIAQAILAKNSKILNVSDFISLVYRLLADKSIMETVVLAKTLSFIPGKTGLQTLYNRLLLASNMSIEPHRYTGLSLSNLDAEETSSSLISTDTLKILRLSCFAWALFMPDEQHDYTLYNNESTLMTEIEGQINEISPSLKQVFTLLFELKNYAPAGFSKKVLANFLTENNRKCKQLELIQRAEDILPEPQIRQHIHGVPELLASCFGKNSELYKCMDIVCNSKMELRLEVQSTLESFSDQGVFSVNVDLVQRYSDQKIEDYIDKMWKNTVTTRLGELKYSPRNTVEINIKKRLDVISEWLDLTNNAPNNISEDKLNQLNKIKNQLLTQLETACEQLDENYYSLSLPVQAGISVLSETFKKLSVYLKVGAIQYEKWQYVDLLSSYQINLNNELKPNIISKLQDVFGFEPWRRMLQHIVSPKITPLEALQLIDNRNQDNWYNNYGTAAHLNLYLYEKTGRSSDDLSGAHSAARQEACQNEEMFKSEFELKYAYGCIEESTKESIFQTVSVLNSYFVESGDFAHYRAFLAELSHDITSETLRLESIFASRVKELREKDGLTNQTAPILENIDKNLQDKNFAVAEEYLNRLDRGERTIPEEELEIEKEINYHVEFLNKYDNLYKICTINKGDVLKNWGFSSVEREFSSSWSNRHKDNAKNFIESWPMRKDLPQNVNAVVKLLKYLGFDSSFVEKDPAEKIGDKYNHYKVSVGSIKKHLRDYPHPISSYGTLMNRYIHVVCLFGTNSANELINIMTNKLQLGGNTIVLMDGALSISDRRKVAEQFKSQTSGQNSFLLIDRVLILYLATLDQGERLVAMLKCTLPYTFYQPFSKDGGSIADEMFFGRKAELNDILHPTGACLVYGGRQLGKTALLERAKSIAHQPSEKKFALYIDIYKQNEDGLIKRLCDELKSERLKLIKTPHLTLEGLCKELEEGFDSGKIVQLQLFIDETDDFLGEASLNNYSTLRPLLDLKRKTKNQFKFVLAGLHNVARSRRALDNNGILPQFGAPLCIKPLSSTDAKKLVERPLAYLGFEMESGRQLALILANTNYYPGILHFFCYTLVQSVSDKYKSYYSVSSGNPPYLLSDDQLKTIFASEDLNRSIKDKLHMTLNLDVRYKMIANIFACLYYEDEKKEITKPLGYDITKIKTTAIDISIPCLRGLSDEDLEALLYEMVDMGILWSKPNSNLFRFRKNSFPGIIGAEDFVIETLLLAEGEVSIV